MTAEEFGTPMLPRGIDWYKEFNEMMVEFAKFHVKAVLEAAASEVDFDADFYISMQEGFIGSIDKNSILTAYPLENIK